MKMILFGLLTIMISALPLMGAVINVPASQTTIQAGINAAANGDTVLVADGTYTGAWNRDIDLMGKEISVLSQSGPENCVIDCFSAFSEHRGFYCHRSETNQTLIEGFTIINGDRYWGSGIFCDYSSPVISNCIMRDNRSADRGTVYGRSSSLLIIGCKITDNLATDSGGIYLYDSDVEITDCIISDNIVQGSGGGIYLVDSTAILTGGEISGNTILNEYLGNSGGGIYSLDSQITVANCIIRGNTAPLYGGGIYHSSDLTLTNCLIAENTAMAGGGIYNAARYSTTVYGGDPELSNTFQANIAAAGADLFATADAFDVDATFNHFSGYYLSDYYVSNQEKFDLTDSTSLLQPILQDVFVSPDGNDANDGLTQNTPFRTIHHALQSIYATEENPIIINLLPGTYSESQTSEQFPLPLINWTTISGDDPQAVIVDGEDVNALFYGYLDNVKIEGITLTSGKGSGVTGVESSLELNNCIISENKNCFNAEYGHYTHGGGIAAYDTLLTVTDCRIENNYADGEGGGIFFGTDSNYSNPEVPTITNCIIRNNSAGSRGGGLSCAIDNWDPDIIFLENCTIENNLAVGFGGGMYCEADFSLWETGSLPDVKFPEIKPVTEPDCISPTLILHD